ncbi:FkbM family methyltransferase, partial [Chamaesiphon sp. OTE_20_metabat_361]|uniref:FkbM family methyltransferase n=1 Tax=Chamaesiphon sp. OTE_20_metabat_361 TaxID=2964689 RepID=UPI00286B1474
MNNNKSEKNRDIFISYAQNFEDVLLNRVFRDRLDGFYIDIGALHPTSDSVTRAFYDRGWSGINIEPIKDFYDAICRERCRDTNLNIAVSDRAGNLEFFQIVQQPGNSTLDKKIADKVASEKGLDVISYNVAVNTLADICEEYI